MLRNDGWPWSPLPCPACCWIPPAPLWLPSPGLITCTTPHAHLFPCRSKNRISVADGSLPGGRWGDLLQPGMLGTTACTGVTHCALPHSLMVEGSEKPNKMNFRVRVKGGVLRRLLGFVPTEGFYVCFHKHRTAGAPGSLLLSSSAGDVLSIPDPASQHPFPSPLSFSTRQKHSVSLCSGQVPALVHC